MFWIGPEVHAVVLLQVMGTLLRSMVTVKVPGAISVLEVSVTVGGWGTESPDLGLTVTQPPRRNAAARIAAGTARRARAMKECLSMAM